MTNYTLFSKRNQNHKIPESLQKVLDTRRKLNFAPQRIKVIREDQNLIYNKVDETFSRLSKLNLT